MWPGISFFKTVSYTLVCYYVRIIGTLPLANFTHIVTFC